MRARLAALACAAALAAAACGDDGGPAARARDVDPFETVEPTLSPPGERAAPRWERIAALSGSGDATEEVDIADGAIQWRLKWRCASASLVISSSRAPGEPIVDGDCPGTGRGFSIDAGAHALEIEASGKWSAVVEQQVDAPLFEDPLPEMEARKAEIVARGDFYPIERRGSGEAALYRLPGGRLALRLEDFETSNNTDLFVWLSRAARPRTTKQVVAARHVELELLKSTIGEHNYEVPTGVRLKDIGSVVIWCEPIRIAYTAAALR